MVELAGAGPSGTEVARRLHYAVVAPVPPMRGGIAQHSGRLVEALRGRGHRVDVHAWRRQYPRLLYRRPERDATAEETPGVSWDLHWGDPRTWVRAARASADADRLVLPWTVPFHAPAYLTMLRVSRLPAVVVVHNERPHERFPFAQGLAGAVLRRADLLVTHATSVSEGCAALAPDVPILQVPMPPLLPVESRVLPGGPLRLVALGYLRDYKGTDLAIEAVGELARRGCDVRLTVAGEPWDGDARRWERLVEQCGVGHCVDLRLRYLSDAEIGELIADHHALVAPYRSASQSAVVSQAIASGRPVVATRVGGLPDLVDDGVSGVLVDPDDAMALADGIERLAGELPTLARGASAVDLSWDRVARVLESGTERARPEAAFR